MERPSSPGRSVAPNKGEGCLAHHLRDLPEVPVHPLRLILLKKGLTLAEAAPRLGWSLRTLLSVVTAWHRPKDAAIVAGALGRDVDQLFPRAVDRDAGDPADRLPQGKGHGRSGTLTGGSSARATRSRGR